MHKFLLYNKIYELLKVVNYFIALGDSIAASLRDLKAVQCPSVRGPTFCRKQYFSFGSGENDMAALVLQGCSTPVPFSQACRAIADHLFYFQK